MEAEEDAEQCHKSNDRYNHDERNSDLSSISTKPAIARDSCRSFRTKTCCVVRGRGDENVETIQWRRMNL
jgi:hypothetical protein